jgi:D-xylose transport system substrate-binding protein
MLYCIGFRSYSISGFRFYINTSFIFMVTVFVSPLVCITGCHKTNTKPEIFIGVSLPTLREIGWVRYKSSLEQEAKRLGVRIQILVADQSPTVQANQIDTLLDQNPQAIIVAPADADSASSFVKKAHQHHTFIVSLDRPINAPGVDYLVQFDAVRCGAMQAQALTQAVPKGKYLVFFGAPTDKNAFYLKQGAMSVLQPLVNQGTINIKTQQFIEDWSPAKAQSLVEQALIENHNDIQGILMPNDNTAGGAIQALKEQHLDGKVFVTGMDFEDSALRRIAVGSQSMTLFNDHVVLAKLALDTAYALATHQSPRSVIGKTGGVTPVFAPGIPDKQAPSIMLPGRIVSKQNLLETNQYLQQEMQ